MSGLHLHSLVFSYVSWWLSWLPPRNFLSALYCDSLPFYPRSRRALLASSVPQEIFFQHFLSENTRLQTELNLVHSSLDPVELEHWRKVCDLRVLIHPWGKCKLILSSPEVLAPSLSLFLCLNLHVGFENGSSPKALPHCSQSLTFATKMHLKAYFLF